MAEDARKALELAIGKIGKAYGDLLKVAEKHGDDIAKEDYDKARYFLDQTIGKIWDKIEVVREVAKATSGSFSLDSVEVPETVTFKFIPGTAVVPGLSRPPEHVKFTEQPADPAVDPRDGKALAKAIGGRLTKAAKAALASGTSSINTDFAPPKPAAPKPAVVDDDDDGVSFLDED